MKILHIINTLSVGGAELHLLFLCRYLKKLGVVSVIACLREQVKDSRSLRSDFEKEGIRVINLEADSRYDVRFIPRFIRLLGRERPQIVHSHLPRADFAGALGHLRYPHIPWVCSIHAIYSVSWSGRRTLAIFDRLWRRADAIIAISQAVKDWLVQERQIPPAAVTVIHYGIEVERYGHHAPTPHAPALLKEKPVIGVIGRLEPGKGHEILIRAMGESLKQIPQASLQIAGHDPRGYRSALEAVIGELDLRKRVQLVGFQSDVPAFLHSLEVFALASHSEGFGQVIIEAMAAGKPVVAGRIAPLTEIVVDGETGLLVEPQNPKAYADAICWLLTHPYEAKAMGNRGKERVRSHFSAERMAVQTLSLYRIMLESHHI